MQITDAIADMLTRIRNAGTAGHSTVLIPASNLKKAIAQILLEEGYITRFECIEDDKQGMIKVTLKFAARKSVSRVSSAFPNRVSAYMRIPKISLRYLAVLASPLSPHPREL